MQQRGGTKPGIFVSPQFLGGKRNVHLPRGGLWVEIHQNNLDTHLFHRRAHLHSTLESVQQHTDDAWHYDDLREGEMHQAEGGLPDQHLVPPTAYDQLRFLYAVVMRSQIPLLCELYSPMKR